VCALAYDLRRQLEIVIIQARDVAEAAARSALQKRAVDVTEPFSHFGPREKELRTRLRARGRQVGDIRNADKTQSIDQLTQELAYEFWHRMLFARFLAENHLLMHPDGVAVSLEECEELAKDAAPPAPNGFVLAARYASTMLPQIFRTDDVLLEIDFAPEQRLALEKLLISISRETFLATDSLGWVYQFWQSKRKQEVNASGNKIGAGELPAVTQLFTEDYMVDFLLDNTLGAWWAGKHLEAHPPLAESAKAEDDVRKAVSLPGAPWNYLRFVKGQDEKWRPAAGVFGSWPKEAKAITCLDPCMGSGHFVVAMLERLVAMRIAVEHLDEKAAVAAVIRDNLFGLEIDPRCTQIAAFNLALAAWRRLGYCTLPALNLACSGLAPHASEADWLKIVSDNQKLQGGMERLYRLFEKAAVLGSLINPRAGKGDLLVAAFHDVKPLLEKALARETVDARTHEMAVTARGLAKAAEILAGKFTLVATNVPYLGRGKQEDLLKDYCKRVHPEAKADLGTCFVERCLDFCAVGGIAALVTPQSWVSQDQYSAFRKSLLQKTTWLLAAQLGPGAFRTITGEVVKPLLYICGGDRPAIQRLFQAIDVTSAVTVDSKAQGLAANALLPLNQQGQMSNPKGRVSFSGESHAKRLLDFADYSNGIQTGDLPRFSVFYWELSAVNSGWAFKQTTLEQTSAYGGMHHALWWQDGNGDLASFVREKLASDNTGAWLRGKNVWGKKGVLVSAMGSLQVSLYLGDLFDDNTVAIIPHEECDLPAIWAACSDPSYCSTVRKIDKKLNVRGPLVEIPFDLAQWQKVAEEEYPHGLPKPFSSDPKQWLFNGHPKGSNQPLHVAVARFLAYHWPRQTGSTFPDCPALGPDGLEKLEDDDGIVCVPAVRGETPAAERLLEMLHAAYAKDWTNTLLHDLLTKTGCKAGTNLDDWLRNSFFEQHCKLFDNRPFIWHIWDGRKDGFSALVNYHKLDHKALENLTYSYLGDWIIAQSKSDKAGADLRLGAAQELQSKLKLILAGEPPYDIFVRWKPLHKQAIGWHPYLDDGVRMNIRPFIEADILRNSPNISWNKDRGKEPERDKHDYPWFWSENEPVGDRVNDVHLTNQEKQAARQQRKGR
jgi:hypothetical protein